MLILEDKNLLTAVFALFGLLHDKINNKFKTPWSSCDFKKDCKLFEFTEKFQKTFDVETQYNSLCEKFT